MSTVLNVLIVEDNPDDAELIALQLTAAGFRIKWQCVETEADFQAHLAPPPDLILCDWRLPRFSGRHALRLLREQGLDVPFIIVSGSIGEEAAIDVLREGAYDYVLKDRPTRLGMAVQRALQDQQVRFAQAQAEAKLAESEERFRVALKNSPVIVFNHDRELRYTWIYNAHPSFDAQAVIGKTDSELLPTEESNLLMTIKRAVLQTGIPAREEVRITIGGHAFFYDLTVEPLYDATGAVIGITCASVDITKRKRIDARLRQQATALAAVANAVIITDREERIQWLNPAFTTLTGYTAEESRGRTLQELLSSGFHDDAFYQTRRAHIQAGQVWRGEMINRRKDGMLYNDETTVTPLLDEQGVVSHFIAIKQDVTARRQHERELEMVTTVSAALRTAMTRAAMLPIILDQLITQLQVEGAALEMLNPVNGELLTELGRGVWAPLTGVTIAPGVGLSAQILRNGQPYLNNDACNDPHLLRPDALGVCCAIAGVPLAAQGAIIGLLWIGSQRPLGDHDLRLLTATANIAANAIHRVALYEQTKAQASQMSQIINTVPQGVLLLDGQGRILLANQVAVADLALLAPTSGDTIGRLGDRPLAELLTVHPDGLWHEVQAGSRIFAIVAQPIREHGMPEEWVMLINDVTKARQAQTQLQQQERLATVGQLAAGIAHDFNNILTVILTYSQMLKQTPALSERNQHRLSVIHEQATRATDLIRQVLDFSRQSVLERRPLDLPMLLKEQIKLLERTLPTSIILRLECGQDACVVHADSTSIQQVVMNLAINARDAMPTGGSLTIGVERITLTPGSAPLAKMPTGDWVRLTIRDSGAGIPAEVLPRIFDPFFTTKAPDKGTGLGLAQVYGIVSQHGGYMDVKTAVGIGTTFFIYLPAVAAPSPALPQADTATLRQGQGQLLLVVEDNVALRMALVDMLTLLNYHVIEAGNGQEALAVLALRGDEVALMVSDVVMPEMDGITLLRTLRERGWTKPIILLTGYPLDQGMETLWSYPVHSFLLKPPSMAELDQALTSALGLTAAR